MWRNWGPGDIDLCGERGNSTALSMTGLFLVMVDFTIGKRYCKISIGFGTGLENMKTFIFLVGILCFAFAVFLAQDYPQG